MNFEKPLTCLITKGELTPENFAQRKSEILCTVNAAIRARISMVQIREKRLTGKQLFELTRESASVVFGSTTKLMVNGRPDIAALAGAGGVHLPEDGLPVGKVRNKFPGPFLIGVSVHSLDAARWASEKGADFVIFGPVFDSGEKKGKGFKELTSVCAELGDFPVVAVGGIDESNLENVMNAGATGYAAITYLNDTLNRVE